MPHIAPPRRTHPARAAAVVSRAGTGILPARLPLNRELAAQPQLPANQHEDLDGVLAPLAERARAATRPAQLPGDARWWGRRCDERGRFPAREILEAAGPETEFVVAATSGRILLTPVSPGTRPRGRVVVFHGDRLTLPTAARRTAGISAPGDLLLVPGPEGAWAVMAASAVHRALTLLAGFGPEAPSPDQPSPLQSPRRPA